MKAALHQDFAFSLLDQLHALCRGLLALIRVDDLERADVRADTSGQPSDFFCGANQHGLDEPRLGRLYGPSQRGFVARIDDDRSR